MVTRRLVITAAGASALNPLTPASPLAEGETADRPVAETDGGRVRGTGQDGIRVFKGIPYGADTRSTRFRPPLPPKPWIGIRDANAFGKMSPQLIESRGSIYASWTYDTAMSEDCLVLNVWTPGLRDGRKRPVMVWLHGGDFSSLSGSRNVFDGTRLARKGDVVVVTLNHRLNIFGYLHLDQLLPQFAGSGNAGMLDIVAALGWVRDNIAEFGGDPANVTIFGQSGGGAKVTTLMAMPAARGLFHKAIVQSGSYYLQAMTSNEGTKLARSFLAALDIPVKDAAILADLPLDRLLTGLEKTVHGPGKANYRPVVDGTILPAGPFSPAAPEISARIPMIVGTTATEMSSLLGGREPALFDLDEAGLKQRLGAWFAPGDIDRIVSQFRATRPSATQADIFFAVATDKRMREGAWHQAERKSARRGAPVWLYELDWKTPVEGGKWGSPHSLCLAFVFDNVAMSEAMVGTGPEPQALAEQMSGAWLAFARHGNPNHGKLPRWAPYTKARRVTMVFDETPKAVADFRGDERTLLATLAPPSD